MRPARIGKISFWAAVPRDKADRETEQQRGLLDQLTRLSVPATTRQQLRSLCAQVKPETWPFGKRMRTPGTAPERWDEEDLPAVALVIAVFHDAYSGGPALLTRELREICEKVARARFVLDDLNPMILHMEHHLQGLAAAQDLSVADEPNGLGKTAVQLEDDALVILCTLADSPSRLKQGDLTIIGETRLHRKTVSRHLKVLTELGFVDYNPMTKKGAAITSRGREYLDARS